MKSCRFFCFFSWHSRFGTWFWLWLEQKSSQKSWFQPHKNKKSGKGSGSVQSLGSENSWESPPGKPPLGTGTVRIRSFTLFLQVFPSLTGSRPLLHRLSHCNIRTGNTGCCKTFCWAGCYWCSVSTEIYSTYGGGWACCERMLSELNQVVCA